jgi:hypothetical protein
MKEEKTETNIIKLCRLKGAILKFFLFGLISIFFFGTVTISIAGTIDPVKIEIQTKTQSISEGDIAPIKLVLKDANNRNATAPKELTVGVEVRSQEGVVTTQKINIEVGEGEKTINLPLNRAGIVEIRASQKELLGGSTFIHVKTKQKIPKSISPPTMLHEKKDVSIDMLQEKPVFFGLPADKKLDSKPNFELLSLQKETGTAAIVKPETATIVESITKPSGWKKITLRQSRQRPLRADGNDAATIYAFLLGDESVAPREISIRLFNNKGSLIPKPLVIPEGKDIGSAVLTSNEAGIITVEYLDSTPKLDIEGDKNLNIPFAPPITNIEIKASPPAISLEEKADLVVRLLDNNGKVVATDNPLTVSFTIDKGRGKLQDNEVTIPEGSCGCRTKFNPTMTGIVEISASAPNILSRSVPIKVTFPVMLMLLSVFGGLIGGLIKLLSTLPRKKDFNRWTVLFGIVTGPLLYWAITFGAISLFPDINALNLLSAFFISVIGGWSGTSVFSFFFKKKP